MVLCCIMQNRYTSMLLLRENSTWEPTWLGYLLDTTLCTVEEVFGSLSSDVIGTCGTFRSILVSCWLMVRLWLQGLLKMTIILPCIISVRCWWDWWPRFITSIKCLHQSGSLEQLHVRIFGSISSASTRAMSALPCYQTCNHVYDVIVYNRSSYTMTHIIRLDGLV